MQYKILASDYDNTLVPFGESQPRPAMVKAVKKLQAVGGKFVLSTGRAWSAINRKGQLGGIRFDYAITCNGACVVDKNGTIVAEHPMTNEEMYALVDFCEDYNYPLQFDFKDAYYAYCEYDILHKYYDQMNSVGLDCVDGEDQDRHLIDMPHAAFCIFPEGALERFSEKYGHLGLHFMQTGGQLPDGSRFYDIVRGGIDKSTGLADLCEKMGLSLAEAVAAGDSANDVGMLKAAGLGCCMSNGTDEAKAAADRVIGDVRDKDCILFDDMVDTGGSLCNAAKALIEVGGAKSVQACASHGVLSGPAIDRINDSVITELALLDTIPAIDPKKSSKIKYLQVAPMFAEAIERIYQEISISKLFR